METPKLWKTVLSELELSVSKATYQTCFAKTELLALEGGVATIGVPNPVMRTMVETRYYSLVKSILDHHVKDSVSLVFSVSARPVASSSRSIGPLFSSGVVSPEQNAASIAKRLHIRTEYTFHSFAVSTTNQIAYAAATAVAKSPGTAYNPLFLYGGVGVGKTHLMHAVANELLGKRESTRVVYCMGEEFLNEIVEAIQTKTASRFKQKYRSADLLLVDDVQFIAGKQTAQEEFFHTFNAVHREGKQIILTSDRHPDEISRLEDRLRSRFEGGLIVDISAPDFELRAAIVNIKAGAMGLTMPADAARAIAASLTDARAIEGFLKRLTTEMALNKQKEITTDLVSSALRSRVPAGENGAISFLKKRVSPQEVLDAVGEYFDIKPTTLKGPKRDRPIARPRQLFMYLCKTELNLTLDDIGGVLGGRDHTTIMHGVDTIIHELPTNERLRDAVSGIKQKLWA